MADLQPAEQRQFAVDIVQRLRGRGFVAYWAGGCVRDDLMGIAPKDYDVATDAQPAEIRKLFGERRTLALGAAFGVITVLGSKSAGQIEVATFRSDASYSDGRHPDAVTFSTPEVDAQRRDFTINGLFFDPISGEVIDYVDGQADIQRRVVRAIGNATARLAEDKLRMLRAIRFTARFGFTLDAETAAAIRSMARQVHLVSVERIATELRSMLENSNRAEAMRLLAELGLLGEILPEIDSRGAAWLGTLAVLTRLPGQASFTLSLAALAAPFVDGLGVLAIGERLKLANREIDSARWLVEQQAALTNATSRPWPELQRLLIRPGIEELMTLHSALVPEDSAVHGEIAACREFLRQPPDQLNPRPLLDGNDLIEHGVPRGKIYQWLLEKVRDAQLEKQIIDKPQALSLVDDLLRNLR